MEQLKITSLGEFLLHIDKEVEKRNIPEKQKRRTTTFIKKLVTQAYGLGISGSTIIELSDKYVPKTKEEDTDDSSAT